MIEITPQYLASQGLSESFPARFWAKVQKSDGCWLWTGARTHDAYGRIRRGSYDNSHIQAHIASWILNFGPTNGNWVLHHCDNPPCIRPDHLFLGSAKDNTQDALSKNRMAIGSRHPLAVLDEQKVRDIKRMYSMGNTSHLRLAKLFGVSEITIYRVVHNLNWKHVQHTCLK